MDSKMSLFPKKWSIPLSVKCNRQHLWHYVGYYFQNK